ncbi:short-chain dehydrogenase [Penicillium bovifimosum]|uniref:Short-chain dehydrogenase n=1 Tax=Penicillium bovifimosum TaxID=126998 RepID=A0A9W9HBF0_9EURO|nr:short-chain dehydrogenase [Penicillium bovifimosum]KAJ5142583.1 short-chain dehydrogenase [Penicillium bovifimosum]
MASSSPFTPPTSAPSSQTQELAQIELQDRLNHHSIKALHYMRSQWPQNTSKAYVNKQKEWQSFCKNQGFPDGELVTEKKLVYFLDTEVLNRPLRSCHHKKDRTRQDRSKVAQTLGTNSITQYVSAIVDLWKFQKSIGTNSSPNPRGYTGSALMTGRLHKESERKREQYLDRAAGTLQDGYSRDKIKDFIRYCWQGWRSKDLKHRKPQAQESYLRTAVDFLFSHNMLLRGESRRCLQFPDLFTISMPNEGPTPCWPMIMIMDNGKTNQFGRLQYMGVMRHQDPLLCTMSQAAFYLFYRWQIVGESPPQFRSRPQWYNFHFFKGSDRDKPISYESQLKWANEVYEAINLSTAKKTHAGRAQGSKQAELEGVEENQIRRAGQWNQDAMTNCYLTHLPRKFLRSMAGHQPDAIGNYRLPWAKVQPPDSLIRALWPWIDQWLAWFQSNDPTNEPPSGSTTPSLEQEDRDDMAAQGFLQLLSQLRIVLLQDSVLLQAEFPGHSMGEDPVFAREDYKIFAGQVRQSLVSTETPQEIQLRQTLPIIADRLSILQKDIHQAVDLHGSQTHEQLGNISRQLHDLLYGQVTFAVRAMDASYHRSADTRLRGIHSSYGKSNLTRKEIMKINRLMDIFLKDTKTVGDDGKRLSQLNLLGVSVETRDCRTCPANIL